MCRVSLETSGSNYGFNRQSLPTEVSPEIDRSRRIETHSANIPYQSKGRKGIVASGNLNPSLQINQNILNIVECENVTEGDCAHHSGEYCLFNLLEVSDELVLYEKSASLYLRNQSVSQENCTP